MEIKLVKSIKKVIIAFFVIVFILGFFSKSIINSFLPKVSVQAPTGKFIKKTLEISGVIEPQRTYKVRLDRDVIIDEFFVQKGDEVKVGDPIFKVNSSYIESGLDDELSRLQTALEEENVKLNKLNGAFFIKEESDIQELKDTIEKQNTNIIKSRQLFEQGAISEAELNQQVEEIDKLKRELVTNQILLEQKKDEASLEIKEILSNIERLKSDIDKCSKKKGFYSIVDAYGIYHSDVNGIAYNLGDTEYVLGQNTVLADIAIIEDYKSLKFVAFLPEEEQDFVSGGGYIDVVYDVSDKPLTIRITNISKIVENNHIRIEGVFQESRRRMPTIGERISGTKEKEFRAQMSIPKAAVVPIEGLKSGCDAYVYVVDKKEGILGTEYIAVKVRTLITAVGDSKVSVENLGGIEDPMVITNLSYKIRDGVRVFLWQ